MPRPPVIVVEDDPFTRLIPLVLDPNASKERRAAFADFMSTDEPDFAGWCARVRAKSPGLYPAEVRLVESEEEMRANLKDCVALVVESFRVSRDDLTAAPKLKAVQKFGTRTRNIDTAACAGDDAAQPHRRRQRHETRRDQRLRCEVHAGSSDDHRDCAGRREHTASRCHHSWSSSKTLTRITRDRPAKVPPTIPNSLTA